MKIGFPLRSTGIALLTLLIAFGSFSCKTPDEPQLREITSLLVKKDRKKGFTIDIGMVMFNPNKYKIKLLNYDFEVFVNGNNLGNSTSTESLSLNKGEEKELQFTIKTDINKLAGGALGMLGVFLGGKKKVRVKITGDALILARGVRLNTPVYIERPVDLEL